MSNSDRLEQEQIALAGATREIRAYVDEIVDEASFVQINAFSVGRDRLNGAPVLGEGVLCGTATVNGYPVVVIAQNAACMYGSFGKAQADKICRAFALAATRDIPVISVLDSSGARVGEGVEVLEAYGAVLKCASDYWNEGGLHLCVIKGQALGLFAAYAQLADYRLMQKGAVMAAESPAVVAARTGKAQKEFASADAVAARGGVDYVCETVLETTETVEAILQWVNSEDESDDDPNREEDALSSESSVAELLRALLDDGEYLEYRADAGKALRCVMGSVNNTAVGVVACDYAAAKTIDVTAMEKLCDFSQCVQAAGATLVTLVNSDGLADDDQVALAQETSAAITYFTDKTLNKIAVCVGHAVGAAYTLLASKGLGYQYSVAFEDAVLSPIAPDAAVHLMYADRLREEGNTPEVQAKLAAMYGTEESNAFRAAAAGYVDEVIYPCTLRPYVANALALLSD